MKMKKIGSNQTELQISVSDVYPYERILILFSYETPVAALVPGRGWLRTDRTFSKTTTKHINRWLDGDTIPWQTVPHKEIENLLGVATMTLTEFLLGNNVAYCESTKQ